MQLLRLGEGLQIRRVEGRPEFQILSPLPDNLLHAGGFDTCHCPRQNVRASIATKGTQHQVSELEAGMQRIAPVLHVLGNRLRHSVGVLEKLMTLGSAAILRSHASSISQYPSERIR